MKVGQYVQIKTSGAIGCLVGVGVIDRVKVYDVLLPGDDLPTEFLLSEIEAVPGRSAEINGPRFINDFGVVLDLKKVGLGYGTSPFKPVPAAGIFTPEDLEELAKRYDASRKEFNREDKEKPARQSGPRETLGSTTRYRMAPGSNQIFGGRK
jgi:hypothetical protein